MDEVDSMRIEDFNRLEAFYSANNTFPVAEDEVILDVFRFLKGRDVILEANDWWKQIYSQKKNRKKELGKFIRMRELTWTFHSMKNYPMLKCFISSAL